MSSNENHSDNNYARADNAPETAGDNVQTPMNIDNAPPTVSAADVHEVSAEELSRPDAGANEESTLTVPVNGGDGYNAPVMTEIPPAAPEQPAPQQPATSVPTDTNAPYTVTIKTLTGSEYKVDVRAMVVQRGRSPTLGELKQKITDAGG